MFSHRLRTRFYPDNRATTLLADVDKRAGSDGNRVVTENDGSTARQTGPKTGDVAPRTTNANRDGQTVNRPAETSHTGDRLENDRHTSISRYYALVDRATAGTLTSAELSEARALYGMSVVSAISAVETVSPVQAPVQRTVHTDESTANTMHTNKLSSIDRTLSYAGPDVAYSEAGQADMVDSAIMLSYAVMEKDGL